MKSSPIIKAFQSAACAGICACTLTAEAVILAPYAVDGDTLHLWHLDATAAPALDAAPAGAVNLTGLLNGATLGNTSFPGFGTAVSTVDGGQDGTSERNALLSASEAATPGNVSITLASTANGAFTFEALIWIGFDPAKNLAATAAGGNGRNTALNILSGESGTASSRIFQFRIVPAGMDPDGGGALTASDSPAVTFENVRGGSGAQSLVASIPTTGPDAIVSNGWYHVAVTYNGEASTPDNFKMYWTRVEDSRTAANPLPIVSAVTMLSGLNPMATVNTPFMVGNDGRNRNSNFIGLVDEVRISRVARAADEMLFGSAEVAITTSPQPDVVAVGQPFSFSVSVSGLPPFQYQWRSNSVAIPAATNSSYAVAAAALSDAGTYDVIVTNAVSSKTSTAATLTVRQPLNLTWAGGLDWDSTNINWDSDNDTIPDRAFTAGDNVIFESLGVAYINLTEKLYPSLVTVNAPYDYTFSTFNSAGFTRNTRIVKKNTGTLNLQTPNSNTGAMSIEEGVVQVGTIFGPGTISHATITNSGGLVFGSAGTSQINTLAGSGGVTNTLHNVTIITNVATGALELNSGSLVLVGAESAGAHSSITLNASANPGPTLSLGGDVHLPAGTRLDLLGTTASPDTRCTITCSTGTNSINGTMNLEGDGTAQLFGAAGGQLSIPGINSPAFMGKLILRGAGINYVSGPVVVGKQLSVADASTWVLGPGNSWVYGEAAQGATMRMGGLGALPAASGLNIFGGTLDLAGHHQTLGHLTSTNTSSPYALNATGFIGSSSTTADSTLTLNTTLTDNIFTGVIKDSVAPGTRKVGLTLTGGGSLVLTNLNTYTGDTTINGGTLILSNGATIRNSANIQIASGASLSVLERNDTTFTVGSGQTLKGNGAFSILGNLVLHGTVELKADKTAGVGSNDRVQGVSTLTYGGTLKVNYSGEALTLADAFKLFDAASYSGSFTTVEPASPSLGLIWDTSTLTTDGTLRVKSLPATPTTISVALSAPGQLELSWPASHTGWLLQAQTNTLTVGLSSNWSKVPESDVTNRVLVPIAEQSGAVFFRMVYP